LNNLITTKKHITINSIILYYYHNISALSSNIFNVDYAMRIPIIIEIIVTILFAGAGALVIALFRSWLKKRGIQP